MKSLYIPRFGGPEVFELVEKPPMPMVPGGVRIRVAAAGVNFADLMMRMGMYPEAPSRPFVPGYEVAGTVTETGKGVTTLRTGDRVLALCRFGGYTTEIVVPEFQVRKTPRHLSDVEAAAIPVNFLTAQFALSDMARVRKGDRVLIPSAAGGVGIAAVQIAAQQGAHVVGLVGSPSKSKIVKSLGAKEILTNEEWASMPDKEAGGFDIILDATGGASLKRALRRLRGGGRAVTYGVSSIVTGQNRNIFRIVSGLVQTPIFTPFKLMMENKGIFGVNMLKFFESPEDMKLIAASLDQVLKGFRDRRYKVVIGKTFPLSQGGAAQSHLQSRSNIGKVVLTRGEIE